MLTEDEGLAQLTALAASKDPGDLALAEAVIEQVLAAAPGSGVREAAVALGRLQELLGRAAPPSPLRADILDMIGDRVMRLLEAGTADR